MVQLIYKGLFVKTLYNVSYFVLAGVALQSQNLQAF